MSNKNDQALVTRLRERLEQLAQTCEKVAREEAAQFETSVCEQVPFSAQQIAGEGIPVTLPVTTMRKQNVKVEIRPSEIGQDANGKHRARLFVDRTWPGAGRLDSPECWTDVENPDDANWYVGAAGNKSRPVDAAIIKGWLYHSGPRPIG